MTLLHKFVRLLVLVALIGIGLALAATGVTADRWADAVGLLRASRITVFWTGVGLCCLGWLFVLTGLRRRPRERFLSLDNEGGRVSISTLAIADYVTKLSAEFPSVLRLRPRVIPVRGAVDIAVDVRVKAGPQIHEICELLQQRIRESMTSGLGISQVRHVRVSVKEIVSEHRPE